MSMAAITDSVFLKTISEEVRDKSSTRYPPAFATGSFDGLIA